MPDANKLNSLIKKVAIEAIESTKPVNICFGQVVGVLPLKINLEQKLTLGESQLMLSRNVTNYKTHITVDWLSENSLDDDLTHKHKITGKEEITVHNGLVVGDKVILLRQKGGQKYLVWDRVSI